MFSIDVKDPADSYLRPCICPEGEKCPSKSYCFVEGTSLDKSRSDTIEELSENIWFETKPPRLFSKDLTPLITARKIHISRIIMSGIGAKIIEPDEKSRKKTIVTSMNKKKSAVKFLSSTKIIIDD